MNDDETLEKLTQMASDYATKVMLGTKEQLLPSFVLLKEDPFSKELSTDVIAAPWKNDQEKREAVLAVCLSIIKSKEAVYAYSMVTECWVSNYKVGEKARADRPEHDPQRGEAIMAFSSTGKKQKFAAWLVERDAEGNCSKLVPKDERGTYESWMTTALDKAMYLANFKNEAFRNKGNN
jgi:hypothetical protein